MQQQNLQLFELQPNGQLSCYTDDRPFSCCRFCCCTGSCCTAAAVDSTCIALIRSFLCNRQLPDKQKLCQTGADLAELLLIRQLIVGRD